MVSTQYRPGRPEGPELEYKSAGSLKHPQSLTRAVVAMLNAHGGTVVVGVNDQGQPEGCGDLARQVDRIQSILVDHIEPRPLHEIDVQLHRAGGGEVLEIHVQRGSDAPYAERRAGMHGFWVRTGATVRSLTLPELRAKLSGPVGTTPSTQYEPKPWHAGLEERRGPILVLEAQAMVPGQLRKEELETAWSLERRMAINQRVNGWSVLGDHGVPARKPGNRFELRKKGARSWLVADLNEQRIRFEGTNEFLSWKKPETISEPVIYPYPIVEGPVTFLRMLGEIARVGELDGEIYCQLGVWRPEGWRLGPGAPGNLDWVWGDERWQPPHPDRSIEKTRMLSWSELRDQPDAQAYVFVREVYEDFGYEETQIPFWNPEQHRFVFAR